MVELILKGFLFLVQTLYNIIFAPVLSTITSLFPSLSTIFTYISNFYTWAIKYIVVVRELLLIPRTMVVILLDYYIILFTIWGIAILLRFIINIYNKFKP